MPPRPTRDELAKARKERLEELQGELAAGVEKLRTSEGWKQLLKMGATLHRYSAANIILLLMQNPDITRVAGYRTWQKLDRQVRPKEKALWVLGPLKYKHTEVDQSGQEVTIMGIKGFKPVPVFDISQTTGPDLPGDTRLDGQAPAELWDKVTAMLNAEGYTVTRTQIPGSAKGDTNPQTKLVRIDSNQTPLEALAVLFHEYFHVALEHVKDMDAYRQHRGTMEGETESATYMTLTALGFDLKEWSIQYIGGWPNCEQKVLLQTAQRAVAASNKALEVLAPDLMLQTEPELGLAS